jgi:hypothetical protein
MSVVGKGGLRDFVVKNKIFKGIGNMKKQQFIDDILISKWWRDNIGVVNVDNMGGAETKKDTRGKRTKSLDESFKLRQKLQQDLQLCEIERALMPHMYYTKKYRESNIKIININREDILIPKALD